MTIGLIRRNDAAGNDSTATYPYGFKIFAATDLEVKVKDADGVITTLVYPTQFAVTNVGRSAGGNVVLSNVGGAWQNADGTLKTGYTIAIVRDVPRTQAADIRNQGGFFADVHEDEFDKLTMLVQRLGDDLDRAVKLDSAYDATAFDMTLPAPVAERVIGWNAAADGLANYASAGLVATTAFTETLLDDVSASAFMTTLGISAYIKTLLDDASAPAARVTLGFPAIAAKGDILVGTAADTIATKTVGANGKALAADSSQADGLVYIDNPSRQNLLVNPNWQIDQINEGALYTVNAANVRGPDGWSGTSVGAGVFKLRTLADPDNAALKCLEITCTTADAAIAAADDYFIYTTVEGYDAAALMAGTAAAQSITVQFKFKSNVNGTYGVSIANSALDRRYVGSFVVANANEAEYSVTLTMDTAGVWLYTNGIGLYLRICLAAGANFQAGAAGAWAAGAEQTIAAQANFMSNVANVAYLKRIQLIPGALVQAYRAADLQKELSKAQRYYSKTYAPGTVPGTATTVDAIYASSDAANNAVPTWKYPVTMRASPTVTTYSTATGTSGQFRNLTSGVDVAPTQPRGAGQESTVFNAVLLGSAQQMSGHATANARLS